MKVVKIRLPALHLRSNSLVRLFAGARWHAVSAIGGIRRRLTAKTVLISCSVAVGVCMASYMIYCVWPRTVHFAYDRPTCLTNPLLLPRLTSKMTAPSYRAGPKPKLSIFGYPLYSHTTCIEATRAPTERGVETIAYGNGLLKKHLRVLAGTFPAVSQTAAFDRPVAAKKPLTFGLTSRDLIFNYRLKVGDKTTDCSTGRVVSCDLARLQLQQSSTYRLSLIRLFNGRPAGTLFERDFTTVEAVQITSTSISTQQVVYDQPTAMTLQLNKSITSFTNLRLAVVSDGGRQISTTAALSDKTLTVQFGEALPRSSSLQLTIDDITASDGGYLATPFVLPFTVSGGPKVLGVNIGSSRVQPSSSVVVSFDSPLAAGQSINDFVRIEANGKTVGAATIQNNKVTIKLNNALAPCTQFTVKVLNGLQNQYGVSGGSAWQFKSRVLCQTVFSIGTSVQGRSITAYSFGTGPSKIVVVGATHGDEKSSSYLLSRWVDELEANPARIPSQRTIVVVPTINPDGFAASRRTNANNVDLNRNFPANDWKQGVIMPDQSYNSNGGGGAPLSEPESRALANYILAQHPQLVLTYHAAAGVVIPNHSGDSVAIAHAYDQRSNVGYASNGETDSIFAYDTTGAFEDWLHDSPNIAALLVELWTKTGNEYAKHQDALWYITGLP